MEAVAVAFSASESGSDPTPPEVGGSPSPGEVIFAPEQLKKVVTFLQKKAVMGRVKMRHIFRAELRQKILFF